MKAFFVVIVSISFLFSSCVSLKDYDQLKTEFSILKISTEQKLASMEKNIDDFKKDYNPELHVILSNNIDEATQYYEKIKSISSEMEAIAEIINKLLIESKTDRSIIAENARTSVSLNVVNEFNTLRTKWDLALNNMINISNEIFENAARAQKEAVKAGYSAISAENSAAKAAENSQIAKDMYKNILELSEKVQQLNLRISQLNAKVINSDNYDQKGFADIDVSISDISNRISIIEESLK